MQFVAPKTYLCAPCAAMCCAQLTAANRDVKPGANRGPNCGPVYFCLMDPTLPGEVEIDAGVEIAVTPQIKGALRSLNGVIEVEEV